MVSTGLTGAHLFLVFQSIGPVELLILLVVIGIPAGIVYAIVQAVGKRRKDD